MLWFDRESKLIGVGGTWPGQVSAKEGKGRRLKSKTCQSFGRDNLMKCPNHFFFLNTDAKLSILRSYIKPIELDKISVLGYRDSVFE